MTHVNRSLIVKLEELVSSYEILYLETPISSCLYGDITRKLW